MSSIILNITLDCADPCALARFWAQVTGWPLIEDPAPDFVDATAGSGFRYLNGWNGACWIAMCAITELRVL